MTTCRILSPLVLGGDGSQTGIRQILAIGRDCRTCDSHCGPRISFLYPGFQEVSYELLKPDTFSRNPRRPPFSGDSALRRAHHVTGWDRIHPSTSSAARTSRSTLRHARGAWCWTTPEVHARVCCSFSSRMAGLGSSGGVEPEHGSPECVPFVRNSSSFSKAAHSPAPVRTAERTLGGPLHLVEGTHGVDHLAVGPYLPRTS